MNIKPLFSAIIVTYKGFIYTVKCIDSILALQDGSVEIIVVDNGSDSQDVEKLKQKYGNTIRTIALDKNYGPSYARNRGVREARGTFLAFLDNDTIVHRNWAKAAVAAFAKNPKLGIIQCKILLLKPKGRIDYVGEYLGSTGFLVQVAPLGSHDSKSCSIEQPILAAKSAGMFMRRSAYDKTEGFDDDYFIYVEETDLGWRTWLAGYECRYIPASIVFHAFGTSAKILSQRTHQYNAKFHGSKNHILTLIKNLEPSSMIRILPCHIILWIGLAVYSILTARFLYGFWILNGICWNVIHLGETLKKRNRIQMSRVINDKQLFSIVMRHKPLRYYLQKVIKKTYVGNAESF